MRNYPFWNLRNCPPHKALYGRLGPHTVVVIFNIAAIFPFACCLAQPTNAERGVIYIPVSSLLVQLSKSSLEHRSLIARLGGFLPH